MRTGQSSFFNDKQVRRFTLKEKFEYIFEQLYFFLQPEIEKAFETIYYNNGPKRIPYIKCYDYNGGGINSVNNIQLPFNGIEVEADHEYIKITGERFCYKFPPDMMPEIWKRLKRML